MIVTAYTQCDVCGKKIVLEITDSETQTFGINKIIVRNLDGNMEYDICSGCLENINLIHSTGRKIVLTAYETAE